MASSARTRRPTPARARYGTRGEPKLFTTGLNATSVLRRLLSYAYRVDHGFFPPAHGRSSLVRTWGPCLCKVSTMWFVGGFGFDAGVGPKPLVQGFTGVRKSGNELRQRSEPYLARSAATYL